MTVRDVDGLNAGYASALLEQYLENPDGVPDEWRVLFESGASDLVATHPGLARLVELMQEDGNGHVATAAAPPPLAPPPPPAPAPRPADPGRGGPRRCSPGRGAGPRPHALRRDCSRDGARDRLPHPRPPRGQARPARRRAGRRSGARPRAPRAQADRGA